VQLLSILSILTGGLFGLVGIVVGTIGSITAIAKKLLEQKLKVFLNHQKSLSSSFSPIRLGIKIWLLCLGAIMTSARYPIYSAIGQKRPCLLFYLFV
jgi:hypothetical protein